MKKIILSALIGLSLTTPAFAGKDRREQGVNSIHKPVVSRNDYVFDMAASGNGIERGEAARLGEWLQSIRLGYGDKVSIDSSNAYGDSYAKDVVAAVIASHGLLLSEDTPMTSGAIAPGAVRVIVSRMTASVPGCPNWKSKSGGIGENERNLPGYGCATNSNLAAMIGNPEDLIQGRSSDGLTPSHTSSKAVSAYHAAQPSGKGGTTLKSEGVGK
jgi:pilus assembly protein CpaD